MTTTTRLTALALAAATFTTASLLADAALARPRIPSANAINKVPTVPSRVSPFVSRCHIGPGASRYNQNTCSDNSTVLN
jgi:hypothetical protein